MAWQLQEAKNKLSRVVAEAQKSGPQVITVHGKEAAVLLSAAEYRKLARKQGSLIQFFRKSPLHGIELDLRRPRDTGRKIEL
ncbi:MAG TPA: type II toxin-antitoxin system Phd/YefM family antitoxin [Gammaproteobacteria bacterium]|nr:type II toxin-antitoxin system Phd/YefM family antitoxin [Gammaproteobacteria bacterium]